MGLACEILSGRVASPSTTLTALTMATGDSLAIRSFPDGQDAWLLNVWAQEATAGTLTVTSPRLHDNVQGIRSNVLITNPQPLLPRYVTQRIYAQDTLVAKLSGGGSETDVASLLVWYRNVPGVDAQLAMWSEIKPRIVNILTVETQHTSGGTAGDYGGSLALNANFDLLKANKPYAILGYQPSVAACSVGYKGPDTGNVRIGGPGSTSRIETRSWFINLSEDTGLPCIPIINSANRGATFVDIFSTVTSTAITVDTVLAELSS
jgi:hypothetical protein